MVRFQLERLEVTKNLLLFTNLEILSFISFFRGQAMPECRCGFFVTLFTWEVEIHRLPAINLVGCDDVDGCVLACKTEVRILL